MSSPTLDPQAACEVAYYSQLAERAVVTRSPIFIGCSFNPEFSSSEKASARGYLLVCSKPHTGQWHTPAFSQATLCAQQPELNSLYSLPVNLTESLK